MMRVQLPALTHTLRKPMSHMWELPPDHPLRHGKSRWDPRVSEYVQAAEKGQLQASAEHLLTVKDPNKGAQTLMSASLELTQTGMLPPVLSEAVVSERPATPDRSNGRVPVTRFRAEDTIPTALSLSQKVKENRRAKRANEQLEDMQLKIQLAPRSGRTLMHFESAVRDSKGGVGGRPKLTMFEHKEGAQVYRSYMEPYVLPNGKSAFFYYDAGSIHDEVPVRAGARPQRPSTFPSALQRHMPLAALLDVISKPPGSGIDIALLKPLPQVNSPLPARARAVLPGGTAKLAPRSEA